MEVPPRRTDKHDAVAPNTTDRRQEHTVQHRQHIAVTSVDDEIVFTLTDSGIPRLTLHTKDQPYGPAAEIMLNPTLMGSNAAMAQWLDQLAYTARMGAQAVRALG